MSAEKLLTPDHLAAMLDIPAARAETWAEPLARACACYEINTPLRIAAFIAQIGHESGCLRYTSEIWGPTKWQRRYEGRADLGNTEPGDGFRFRGRGLIQLTGRANYARASNALGVDLLASPELLEQPRLAALSAAWFWDAHHLNDLADSGDMRHITRLINGGYHGLEERMALYERALQGLSSGGDRPSQDDDVTENNGVLI